MKQIKSRISLIIVLTAITSSFVGGLAQAQEATDAGNTSEAAISAARQRIADANSKLDSAIQNMNEAFDEAFEGIPQALSPVFENIDPLIQAFLELGKAAKDAESQLPQEELDGALAKVVAKLENLQIEKKLDDMLEKVQAPVLERMGKFMKSLQDDDETE